MSEIEIKIIIAVISGAILGILAFFGKGIWKGIKNIYYKFKKDKKKKKTDELLKILYKRKGKTVALAFLKKRTDLSEIEIINRIEKAEERGLVKNYPNFDSQYDWILTPKGESYAENLLNKSS